MMNLFLFLTTLATCLSLIAACDNYYVNVVFELDPPEGAECTHEDTQKIMSFVTKTIQRNADKFLASKGINEKFGDFEFEQVRRRDLLEQGEDEEMPNSQYERGLVHGFVYRGGYACGWFCRKDDRDARRGLGFLQRRTNIEVIDWDEFETFMNESMPLGLKAIMNKKPTSEDCVDESLGDWSGRLVWESSTCVD